MSSLQIPSVTIEDLQAFQAKHFPSSQQVTSLDYTYSETVDEEFDDDDGLGYYPDGVKRTLTDEQIRIFRHSEIHSLLREKQLREEELAKEARELTPVGQVAEGVLKVKNAYPLVFRTVNRRRYLRRKRTVAWSQMRHKIRR